MEINGSKIKLKLIHNLWVEKYVSIKFGVESKQERVGKLQT